MVFNQIPVRLCSHSQKGKVDYVKNVLQLFSSGPDCFSTNAQNNVCNVIL